MADDESGWLPKPPPPRPAAREDAIHAALRKFDGEEEEAEVRRKPTAERPAWRRPQFAVALSAMLLVVVGIPAALIGLRNQEAPPPQSFPKVGYEAPSVSPAPQKIAPPVAARADSGVGIVAETTPVPPAEKRAAPPALAAANDQPAAESETPGVAAAAPPPPPPPPPAPPPPPPPAIASADAMAQERAAQEVVVTGSVMRSNRARAEADRAAKARPDDRDYQAFLTRLQGAVRATDKGAIIGMVSFPLRVNYKAGARSYRDAAALSKDFDRIFTPQVRRAVLNQSPDQIFSRDIGAMVGDGELWFDHISPGQVKIIAVNP